MATTTAPTQLTITTEERTWRATLETPKGAQYTLALHRERRAYDASGNQIGDTLPLPAIALAFNDIQSDTVTVGGTTLTVAQLSAFLSAYFDAKAPAAFAAMAAAAKEQS